VKALLDTHVFLWWILDEPHLPLNVRAIISDGGNKLFLSAASCWEIAIKSQLGRISIPSRPEVFVSAQMEKNAIQPLQIKAGHALHVFNLPLLHRDPFDRMLVSQAQIEGLPIITPDPLISKYKVKTIWKR
jgi:PIN domain nuclease of toxin-antitoxin system